MFANTFLLVHKHATALFLSQLIVYEHLYSLALFSYIKVSFKRSCSIEILMN